MGIIRDLKNIFFGASAVTKSAAEKAGDFVKEETEDFLDITKEAAGQTTEAITNKAQDIKDKVTDSSEELASKVKEKASEITSDIMESETVQKFGEMAESVGKKAHEAGGKILEKSSEIAEEVGAKVIEKAGEIKDKVGAKIEETMEKADAWAEHEKNNPKPEFAEDTLDASGSLLEDKQDFFSKADKYASGDYGAFSEGKITVSEDKVEAEKENFEDKAPATGFEDRDGDGNEIIDDAQVEE